MPADATYPLLISDLDGTLLLPGQHLDHDLALELRKFAKRDKLVVVTARHPRGVAHVLDRSVGFVPTVSLNGAGLHRHSWQTFDASQPFEPSTARLIMSLVQAEMQRVEEVVATVYGAELWATTATNSFLRKEAQATGMTPEPLQSKHLDECYKILLIGPQPAMRLLRRRLSAALADMASVLTSNPTHIEVNRATVSKGQMLREFLQSLDPRAETPTIFLGDGENDVGCAQMCQQAWTFESAPAALREVCDGILNGSNGVGVLSFLRSLRSNNHQHN